MKAMKNMLPPSRQAGSGNFRAPFPAVLFFICLLPCLVSGRNPVWHADIGLEFGFGSVVNRVGAVVNGYCSLEDFQVNARIAAHYSASGYGPRVSWPELQLGAGAVASFGGTTSRLDPFLSPVGNQTIRLNSVGYAFNAYLDTVRTSQLTGCLSIQVNKVRVTTENDALAFMSWDRFRTGALQAEYRDGDMKAGVSAVLWTGNPRGAKRIADTAYPARYGYKDLSDRLYGKYSHGVLSLQFQKKIKYFNSVRVEAGVDAEQVRHLLQNRFHDLISFPAAWNRSKTPHYPMLDSDGMPFTFEPGQKVRPARFFFFCGLNASTFY